jgi:protein-disulfide isomerase
MSQEAQVAEFVSEASAEKTKIEQGSTAKNEDYVVIPRTTLNYVVIASVFFAVGLLVGSVSFGSRVDEAAIEVAVQNVLVDAGLVQPPADMDVLVDDDPFIGPEDAPIVIVEFSAYACPYCGRHFNETLEPLLENYGQYIRYVFRDFPTINPNISLPAALAANCAREQGFFWEYHEMLFINQNTLIQTGPAYLNQAASDLGLDTDSFNDCLTEQRYLSEVNDDFNTGVAYGVNGTPAFYINGQAHSGARPYQYFEAIILRELERAGIDF